MFSLGPNFWELTPLLCLLVAVVTAVDGSEIGYIQRNITCSNIKTSTGYNFSHECRTAYEISASQNKTKIGHFKPGEKPNISSEVVHIDSSCIITRSCHNLEVCCMNFDHGLTKEQRIQFTINEEKDNSDPSLQHDYIGPIVAIAVGVLALLAVVVVAGCSVYRYRSKMRTQQREATFLGFIRHLASCFRKANSEAERGEIVENGHCSTVATSPENHTQQDGTLQAVHTHNPDLQPDGRTNYNSLDHNPNTKGTPSTKTDISAPASIRDINRNLRDDPGGSDIGKLTQTHSGWVFSNGGPEVREAEGEPLLRNEQPNTRGSDMTAEAIPLGECSFNLDQNTDVESKTRMTSPE
ncbi:uncharacterized protein LOC115047628 [Echeneis naucrates]|uniref:uncharacterized protein LOC115047628 n=1 Tax=Echeneis naucrates TaxID=173247 RepID=UPI001113CC7E|nr:uncharacterized protein LOC115047628 [Echeneis naucrates]